MWQPSCKIEVLNARAELYTQLRAFFRVRGVLEVETPILSAAGATDPYLSSLKTAPAGHYLQTSPEFAMKRLLAAGSGPIYQICKTFRADEAGDRHNPEFTMLEWYRPAFKLDALLQEISELVSELCALPAAETLSYKQAFIQYCGFNPFKVSDSELFERIKLDGAYQGKTLERDACLDLLLSQYVEPNLGIHRPCFLIDYPASQASLAKVKRDEDGDTVAARAELYIRGIEIANAYDELTDPKEQRLRFLKDNEKREALGMPQVTIDDHLLRAMEQGLPRCAGVALGIDRLLMIKLGLSNIKHVLSFSHERA